MKAVLKLPAYRRLLAAYTLNVLAWSIGELALAVLVYRRTGSAIAAASYFLCAQFGPALIAPAIVARLDRRSVSHVLPGLYSLEAVVFGALAWVAGRFALAPVLVLALVDGVIGLATGVLARAATFAVTSPHELLREGNALLNGSFSVCLVAGPAIGGTLVALAGTRAALLAGAAMFVLIAVTLATATGLPRPQSEQGPSAGRVRAALRYVRTRPVLVRLLLLQAVGLVFFTIAVPVEIVFARHSLHTGPGGYAALLSAWGLGAVGGSVIYARWRSLPGRQLIALGSGLVGTGYLLMAIAPSLAVAIVGAAIGGAGNGIATIAVRTTLQEATDERWMALTISLNDSIFAALPGVGIALGGLTAALAGPRLALAVGGIGSIAITVAVWALLRPEVADAEPMQGHLQATESEPSTPLRAAGPQQ